MLTVADAILVKVLDEADALLLDRRRDLSAGDLAADSTDLAIRARSCVCPSELIPDSGLSLTYGLESLEIPS